MGGSQSTTAPQQAPTTLNNNVPKRTPGEPDTVIIPVDGSQQSEAAFLWYLKHVHREGNTVRVIHCQEIHQGAPLTTEHAYGFQRYIDHCHKPDHVVRVLHCQELQHGAPLSGEQFKADSWVELMNRTRTDSMKIVNHFEEKLKERNIKGSVQFEVGKPGEIVLAYADRYRGTHIVMGTRGFGLLRRTILGSTSEYVIHHAKIPVTVVPPETKSWFF